MNKEHLKKLLEDIKAGKIEVDAALDSLKSLPFEDLGYAKLDTHRELRKGFPEVIFCQGKTIEQIVGIIRALSKKKQLIMATKMRNPQSQID
jgi:NCAIR mutase (PurE)-related protein